MRGNKKGWSVVFAMHIHKVGNVAKGSLSGSAICQNNRIYMSALWRQAGTSRKSGYKWRRENQAIIAFSDVVGIRVDYTYWATFSQWSSCWQKEQNETRTEVGVAGRYVGEKRSRGSIKMQRKLQRAIQGLGEEGLSSSTRGEL